MFLFVLTSVTVSVVTLKEPPKEGTDGGLVPNEVTDCGLGVIGDLATKTGGKVIVISFIYSFKINIKFKFLLFLLLLLI